MYGDRTAGVVLRRHVDLIVVRRAGKNFPGASTWLVTVPFGTSGCGCESCAERVVQRRQIR